MNAPLSTLPPSARPTFAFMAPRLAHWIALGFGAGLSRWAPGTVGTLWAWAAYAILQHWLTPTGFGWLIAGSLIVGWWACAVTARRMNVADPGSIVWDEVVAFWLILWLVTPAGFWGQFAAFALFRVFDAVKRGPVGWADALCKQKNATPQTMRWSLAGFGIIFDDLVAAFCTLVVIALWRAW